MHILAFILKFATFQKHYTFSSPAFQIAAKKQPPGVGISPSPSAFLQALPEIRRLRVHMAAR
jgi:hypothetical protein